MHHTFTHRIMCTTALLLLVATSCKKPTDTPTPATPDTPATTYALGWVGTEDLSNVPVSTNFGFAGAANLPASVDLSAYLPPVKSQGAYGTCVSWATGYYTHTTMEGLAKGYTAAQLASEGNQISARDLFTSLPDNQKGQNCDGSSYTANFDVLQQRGAATLSTVPYTNLGTCSLAGASASWATEAAKHKIKSYRTLDPSVTSIKQELVNKVPVLLGAKLSDNFMTWNSDNVLSSNTTYAQVGQHAGHALTIVGYDDRKGANGAFKVVNSWSTNWGSKGFIWIDYNFLVNTFAQDAGGGSKVLMVMSENVTKPDPTPVTPATTGIDLLAWVDTDFSTYSKTGVAQSRAVDMNIFNTGTTTATPAKAWTTYYMYYNARNAKDYGVLFYHKFTTQGLATNTYQCSSGNCNFNVSLPSNGNLSHQVFGTEDGLEISYKMPATLNGSYYLVLLADPENVLNDTDPEDNYFYTTDKPIVFRNGYAARQSTEGQNAVSFSFKNSLAPLTASKAQRRPFTTAVSAQMPNAYSPDEIVDFIRQQRRDGGFTQKLIDYARQNQASAIQPVR